MKLYTVYNFFYTCYSTISLLMSSIQPPVTDEHLLGDMKMNYCKTMELTAMYEALTMDWKRKFKKQLKGVESQVSYQRNRMTRYRSTPLDIIENESNVPSRQVRQ